MVNTANMRTSIAIALLLSLMVSNSVVAGLITCQDCKRRISDRAAACPGCGGPVTRTPQVTKPTPRQPAQARKDPFTTLSKSMVFITSAKGAASGFVLDMGGRKYVLTNLHTLRSPSTLRVKTIDGVALKITKCEVAFDRDLARLSFAGFDPPALHLEEQAPATHDLCAVYGDSQGKGVLTELVGRVNGVGRKEIEIDAEFVAGNSGSPVLNIRNRVIGVATYVEQKIDPSWVEKGTRFAEVRRFAFRLTPDIKWVQVSAKDLAQQFAVLDDLDLYAYDLIEFMRSFDRSMASLPWLRGEGRKGFVRIAGQGYWTFNHERGKAMWKTTATAFEKRKKNKEYSNEKLIDNLHTAAKLGGDWVASYERYSPQSATVKSLERNLNRHLELLADAPIEILTNTRWTTRYFKDTADVWVQILKMWKAEKGKPIE